MLPVGVLKTAIRHIGVALVQATQGREDSSDGGEPSFWVVSDGCDRGGPLGRGVCTCALLRFGSSCIPTCMFAGITSGRTRIVLFSTRTIG